MCPVSWRELVRDRRQVAHPVELLELLADRQQDVQCARLASEGHQAAAAQVGAVEVEPVAGSCREARIDLMQQGLRLVGGGGLIENAAESDASLGIQGGRRGFLGPEERLQ